VRVFDPKVAIPLASKVKILLQLLPVKLDISVPGNSGAIISFNVRLKVEPIDMVNPDTKPAEKKEEEKSE